MVHGCYICVVGTFLPSGISVLIVLIAMILEEKEKGEKKINEAAEKFNGFKHKFCEN